MNFSIDPRVFSLFPGLRVGVLVAHGVNNADRDPNIEPLLRVQEDEVRLKLHEDTFKDHPAIAVWQEAHKAFGSNPNKFPSSLAALAKRVAKGSELPSISPLVDLYNTMSLKYLLPAGGEDLGAIDGNLRLTLADGSEKFIPLGSHEKESPEAGEVIYCDDKGVVVRKFNWREADRTKLTEETTNAILVLESLSPPHDALAKAMLELEQLVGQYCGGSLTVNMLDREHLEMEL